MNRKHEVDILSDKNIPWELETYKKVTCVVLSLKHGKEKTRPMGFK